MNDLIKYNSPKSFLSVFDDFFSNPFGDFNFFTNDLVKSNINETKDSYKIELSLPGFKKEDVKIEIVGDKLKISSEVEKTFTDDKIHQKQFEKRSFYKQFTLPDNVNLSDIEAEMNDGILNIKIKKLKEKKSNKLEIKIN